MTTIGLIGGIGSGKSEVAGELDSRGAVVIDADRIGHDVLERASIKKQLVALWGADMIDSEGRPDRKRIARKAFSSRTGLDRLNAIVHPPILAAIGRQIDRARSDKKSVVVIDAALLLESGLEDLCDRIVYVRTPRHKRLKQIEDRPGWGSKELKRRERFQIPLKTKCMRADTIINNHSSIEHLRRQCARLWSVITKQKPTLT